MSYEPTNWKAGDTITSAKLNKLEQGVANGGGILIVHLNMGTGTLDKTWQEIHDADVCYIIAYDGELILKLIVTSIFISNENYTLEALLIHPGIQNIQRISFSASFADDYPVIENPNNNNNNNDNNDDNAPSL